MRIATVSKSDAGGGGAGRVAEDLSEWLREDGHEVVHFARWGRKPYGPNFQPPYSNAVRVAKRYEKKYFMNDVYPLGAPDLMRRLEKGKFDVVHFHDLTTAYSIRTLSKVAENFPTVWTLHDLSPFTGGCCYPTYCSKIYTGCGDCPKFGEWNLQGAQDLTGVVQSDKRDFFETFTGPLVAPSPWVGEQGHQAGFLGSPDRVLVVPNGIDLRKYQALRKAETRRWLGIPVNRFVIAIISHDLNDGDKNPASQREALRMVAEDLNPYLLLMGQENPGVLDAYRDLDLKHFGYVSDIPTKNAILSAADVMLNTSLTDTFSLTTLESIASGTPVVAYASGGIPSILEGTGAGILVEPDSAKELAKSLEIAASRQNDSKWFESARARAQDFSHTTITAKYVDVYQKAIAG